MLPVDLLEQKKIARKQFDEKTEELGLVHTFEFDEVWEVMLSNRYRNNITEFHKQLAEQPNVMTDQEEIDKVNPLKHMFTDGCYIREIFNPKDELIVTKIHKISHPYFLLEGEMSIMTETGAVRKKAPFYGITPAGTKRVIYTHTDCRFVTVHVTNKTDIQEIEDEVIAKDFKEVDDFYLQKEEFLKQINNLEKE
jgi:hypothetical protein